MGAPFFSRIKGRIAERAWIILSLITPTSHDFYNSNSFLSVIKHLVIISEYKIYIKIIKPEISSGEKD